jgi:hypothetical protein
MNTLPAWLHRRFSKYLYLEVDVDVPWMELNTDDRAQWKAAADAVQNIADGNPAGIPAAWLYQRFGRFHGGVSWSELYETDREYWEHEAAAVKRAVERGGFKNTTV